MHDIKKIVFFGMATAIAISACGKTARREEATPSYPEWSLVLGEPNEICPGVFDRAVSNWTNENDIKSIRDAIAKLPKHVKQAACRVAKFKFEDADFYATGSMSPGDGGDPKHSEVSFHPALFSLRPTFSQLLIWKERQLVETSKRNRFDADHAPSIFSASQDDFAAALSYVLVHELGHVANFQPEWRDFFQQNCNSDCGWERYQTDYFAGTGRLCFYNMCNRRISTDELSLAYQKLQSSNFISLYATRNTMEDVAEIYAAEVLFDEWKWTLKTTVLDHVFSTDEHWRDPQMSAKRDLMIKFSKVELPPP